MKECLLCKSSISVSTIVNYIQGRFDEEAERGDIVEVSDSLVVYLVEVLVLVKEIATKSTLLRPCNITLTLQCEQYLHGCKHNQ